jgi:hypothetical protein
VLSSRPFVWWATFVVGWYLCERVRGNMCVLVREFVCEFVREIFRPLREILREFFGPLREISGRDSSRVLGSFCGIFACQFSHP